MLAVYVLLVAQGVAVVGDVVPLPPVRGPAVVLYAVRPEHGVLARGDPAEGALVHDALLVEVVLLAVDGLLVAQSAVVLLGEVVQVVAPVAPTGHGAAVGGAEVRPPAVGLPRYPAGLHLALRVEVVVLAVYVLLVAQGVAVVAKVILFPIDGKPRINKRSSVVLDILQSGIGLDQPGS